MSTKPKRKMEAAEEMTNIDKHGVTAVITPCELLLHA
jgi:hypothetical protein